MKELIVGRIEDDIVRDARLTTFRLKRRSTVAYKEWREEIERQIESGQPDDGLDASGIRALFRAL